MESKLQVLLGSLDHDEQALMKLDSIFKVRYCMVCVHVLVCVVNHMRIVFWHKVTTDVSTISSSLTLWLTHSLTHALTHSFIHSLTHSFTHSLLYRRLESKLQMTFTGSPRSSSVLTQTAKVHYHDSVVLCSVVVDVKQYIEFLSWFYSYDV